MTTCDHINTEQIPHTIDRLLQSGARNAHVIPALTKKGRPEYIFLVDCPSDQVANVAELLAAELGVLGVRVFRDEYQHFGFEFRRIRIRITAPADASPKDPPEVEVKLVLGSRGEVLSLAAEYEGLQALYRWCQAADIEISFRQLKELVEAHAWQQFRPKDLDWQLEIVDGQDRPDGQGEPHA